MTSAFHGDAALKADLLARLRGHAAAGTLMFGETRWDGVRGSPLGVSAESVDSADYAARFGYPLALASLLDTVTAFGERARALADTFAWVERVDPGADLSAVPLAIADDVLVRMGAQERAPAFHAAVIDLHRRDLTETVPRADWRNLRGAIEAAETQAEGPEAATLQACGMTCWSLRNSRSVLSALIATWWSAAELPPSDAFPAAEKARAETMLHAIVAEIAPSRGAGERVDIPALFRARDPDLSAGYEADLRRMNAIADERIAQMPGIVLGHIAAAGVA